MGSRVPPKAAHFLRKSGCLGCAVLLCLVCLTLLVSFFFPFHLSLKRVYLHIQAFIHPSLARIFWSSRSDPGPFVWSPYETCNGTFTTTIDHGFTSLVGKDLGVEFVFFDFAGSGLVHVCGELHLYVHVYMMS